MNRRFPIPEAIATFAIAGIALLADGSNAQVQTASAPPAAPPAANARHGLDPADLDRSVSACTSLNTFGNGGWLKANPLPADQSYWGSFSILFEENRNKLRTVLEKAAVTHGSTWHAAGLVGQYRSRRDLTQIMQESVAVYDEIEAETPIDWRPVGSLRIASSAERWQEYRAAEPRAREYGVGFELLDAAGARRLFPHLSTAGVAGAAFVARDGYVDPSSLTRAFEM